MKSVFSEEKYNRYLEHFILPNKVPYKLIEKNGTKCLIWDEKRNFGVRLRRILSKDEMANLWVFAAIRKDVAKAIKKNGIYIDGVQYNRMNKNWKNYDSLANGEVFFGTDVNHAYWRIAKLNNYVSEKLYNKMNEPRYKLLRNKALACLNGVTRIREYDGNGDLIREAFEGDPRLPLVYSDIRNKTYKVMEECRLFCGDGFLKYMTDCVYYLPEHKEKVELHLKAQGLFYTTKECFKMDGKYFIEGDDVKKF